MCSHIIEGFLYEIDHIHLPLRTPSQLRSVRVAMVCEKTNLNVGIRFPSMDSLSSFFNYIKRETHPDLDEEFVMGNDLAARVLTKLVPVEIYSQQKCLESFWLISSMAAEMCNINRTVVKENEMVTCGSIRQVIYLDNDCNDGNAQNSSSSFAYRVAGFLGDKGEERDSVDKVQHGNPEEVIDVDGDDSSKRYEEEEEENEEVEEEEKDDSADDQEIDEEEEENKTNNLKRKRYSFRNLGIKKPKVEIREIDNEKEKQKGRKKIINSRMRCKAAQILRNPKFRWPAERYKLAEISLLRVMKLEGATAEKPILRPQLRAEVRKSIGDTGLLDHLLKHMAGKLAPGGKERFRRRYNPDGAMEYWLEKADLVNIRTNAGVPPPGWMPGDSPTCEREFNCLKDEICEIKREMVDLMATKMQLDDEVGKLRRELEEINSKKKQEEYQAITTKSPFSYGISQKLDELAASLVGDSPVSMEMCKEQLMALSAFVKEIEGGRAWKANGQCRGKRKNGLLPNDACRCTDKRQDTNGWRRNIEKRRTNMKQPEWEHHPKRILQVPQNH